MVVADWRLSRTALAHSQERHYLPTANPGIIGG